MLTAPVLLLLLYNCFVFLSGLTRDRTPPKSLATLSSLFFLSGIPALVYQIVWQRALFAIYGVNAESVAVVVSAFMLGLGLGSLLGGWLSARYPGFGLIIFGLLEALIAAFGTSSLAILRWMAIRTAGASLPAVLLYSLALLLIPTICMGATLPLLVQHVVQRDPRLGYSVGVLYFANTFGSAVACYLCATFLLSDFGQSGSVQLAACVNVVVGSTALVLGLSRPRFLSRIPLTPVVSSEYPVLSLRLAVLLAALLGFVSLGFELVWFRIFVLASWDRAPAFALLLSTYLAGIAAGSYIASRLAEGRDPKEVAAGAGTSILISACLSCYLAPIVGALNSFGLPYLLAAPLFFTTAALLGSVFPLLCRLSVPADRRAGRRVSFIYVANIIGSTSGSLLVGFLLMSHFGLLGITLQLGFATFVAGSIMLIVAYKSSADGGPKAILIPLASLIALGISPTFYQHSFERVSFGTRAANIGPLSHIVENRNGVIEVAQNGAVFGNSVYDGYFNTDPIHDVNLIIRAFALSAIHPCPKQVLMIGLSSGSWAQILANHPQVESLEIVEINPGYLQLIPEYPAIRSVLENPKVQIYLDDGRRWLLSHPNRRFDAIVFNTSFFWRDHSSVLLSTDYLRIVREHLKHGGIYYYNTTGSEDVIATGLTVYPYGLRVLNFLAVSDSPIIVEKERWAKILRLYRIDGRPVFDPSKPDTETTLKKYMDLADTLHRPAIPFGMEDSISLRARIKNPLIITDDNMGWEWRTPRALP